MADREKYYVGPGLRDKIRDTITRVGGFSDNIAFDDVPTRLQDYAPSGSPRVFRVCEFTGTWNKGSTRTLTIKFAPPDSVGTLVASNLMFDLDNDPTGASGARICVVGKDGTAWHFIAAGNKPPCNSMAGKEISSVGYSPSFDTSKLGEGDGAAALFLETGCVKWVRTTQVEYISNITYESGTFTMVKRAAWVFAPMTDTVTNQTLSISVVEQEVVTNISLGSDSLEAARAKITVIASTPISSTSIEVYQCFTATGTTS